jgi:poly(A) polymerase
MSFKETLEAAGFSGRLRSYSALDAYFKQKGSRLAPLPFVFVETNAATTDLARLFDNVRFPGLELADAVVNTDGRDYYIRCIDPDERGLRGDDTEDQAFITWPEIPGNNSPPAGNSTPPAGCTLAVRPAAPRWPAALKGAVLASRYGALAFAPNGLSSHDRPGTEQAVVVSPERLGRQLSLLPVSPEPKPEMQRLALCCILLSAHPERGFELLKASAFVDAFWPELAALDDIDQGKEFHPEGNGWKHTLETFRYRKPGPGNSYSLELSLGLLLHDTGKVLAARSGKKRFDHHAELGASTANLFLRRLGFEEELIEKVYYLVRNHMLPAALPRLPIDKNPQVNAVVNNPLFPVLMELYRCDESSSFKGPAAYYAASGAYRSYLKHKKDPWNSLAQKQL